MAIKTIASLLIQVRTESSHSIYLQEPGYFNIVSSREAVRERNVLLVTRPGKEAPFGWKALFVSTLPGFLDPRELPKLLHTLIDELRKNPGTAVVIECPEYLALHNGFRGFFKFLNALRDHAMLMESRIYLITEPSVWNEREFAFLRRMED
ncbi:hypothetical protein X802_02250 [Thermococcus guaymasensis DSM 11113]|uniref:DUF835 domain-containing protein n=1 Tax=Thermococcus guaymasensis DSM 11113 TaxID=1432656 RepID=A0A0X1KIQ7_9EURY|nr:DUF835 domain-containing protein [Thermococcus guaymasensis]AJC71130.1 hypothetical protein X802_02250 [Thermococcus guaymasensis DSM 11113]